MNSAEYFIDVPLHYKENRILEVAPTALIWVEFQGRDGALCRYAAQFIEAVRIPNLAWKISKPEPGKVKREQRREFVRVPADFPVHLEYGSKSGLVAEVYTRDVSGGGIALYLPKHVVLHPGEMVGMRFTLPNSGFPVATRAMAIRVSDRNDHGYAIGSFEFVNMKESVRQRVIQYTFFRQRTLQ